MLKLCRFDVQFKTGSVGGRDFKRFGLDEDESFADLVFFVHDMHLQQRKFNYLKIRKTKLGINID